MSKRRVQKQVWNDPSPDITLPLPARGRGIERSAWPINPDNIGKATEEE